MKVLDMLNLNAGSTQEREISIWNESATPTEGRLVVDGKAAGSEPCTSSIRTSGWWLRSVLLLSE